MNYITSCNYKQEPHPFDMYIPQDCRFLILGTFPAKPKDRRFNFFYPSGRNRFWDVMSAVSDLELTSFSDPQAQVERKKILNKLKVGLADMGKQVLRQAESSMDTNIFPIEFQDIFRLLKLHPSIEYLVLTSKSKGNSATEWFKAYCKLNGLNFKIKKKESYPQEIDLWVGTKLIKTVLLPSTSQLCPYPIEKLVEFYTNLLIQKHKP